MSDSPEAAGTTSSDVSHYGQIFICKTQEFLKDRLLLSWIPQLLTVLATLLVAVKNTWQKHLGRRDFGSGCGEPSPGLSSPCTGAEHRGTRSVCWRKWTGSKRPEERDNSPGIVQWPPSSA